MPNSTTLYRFFDATAALLYVGVTKHRWWRWFAHERRDWWGQVASATTTHYAERSEALAAESKAIREENPRYNIQGRNRPITRRLLGATPLKGGSSSPKERVTARQRRQLSHRMGSRCEDADCGECYGTWDGTHQVEQMDGNPDCETCGGWGKIIVPGLGIPDTVRYCDACWPFQYTNPSA